MESKIVCFTGHRSISKEERSSLFKVLLQTVKNCFESGALHFRCGGALGFDTLAALAVLEVKKQYPEICLDLILPCPEQDRFWNDQEQQLYRKILSMADNCVYTSPSYYNGVLQHRNRCLVDGADICIAFLKNSKGGGTAFTCAYALRKGLEFMNLADNLNR